MSAPELSAESKKVLTEVQTRYTAFQITYVDLAQALQNAAARIVELEKQLATKPIAQEKTE